MATDAPLLTRQRVFAAKIETTTGSVEALAAADATTNVFDPVFTPDVTTNERTGQSNLSHRTAVHGTRAGTFTLETELVGSGTSGSDPLWASTLLNACGFTASGQTYSPDTDSVTTLTMGTYEDGRNRLLLGCMGTFTMTLTAGNPVRVAWEFSGKLGVHTDVALLAPTYDTTLPPRFASATVTIGGNNYKVNEVVIASNCEVVMREDASDVTGIHAHYIVARRPTVTIDPEAQLYATKDFHADWLAETEAAINIVVGSATGNTITLNAPKAQLTNAPVGDRNGLLVEALEYQCNRSAALGDDELTVAFS